MIEGISRTEHLLQYPAIEDQGAQARDTEVGPKRLPSLQRVRHGTLHFLLNHELELQQHCIALDHHFTVHGKGPPLLHHAAGAATGSFRGKFAGRQQGQRRTRFAEFAGRHFIKFRENSPLGVPSSDPFGKPSDHVTPKIKVKNNAPLWP